MPEPRLVAALGDCALGCDVLGDAAELVGAARGRAAGRHPHPRLPADAASAIAEHLLAELERLSR